MRPKGVKFMRCYRLAAVCLCAVAVLGCSQWKTLHSGARFISWEKLLENVTVATSPRHLHKKFFRDKNYNDMETLTDGTRLRVLSDVDDYVRNESWKWNDGSVFIFYDQELRGITNRRVLRYPSIKAAIKTKTISEGENGLLILGDGWDRIDGILLKEVLQENKDRERFIDSLTTQVLSQSIEQKVNLSLEEAEDLVRLKIFQVND